MYCTKKVTADIDWVGANDRRLSLFENLFPIPRGVSYNSYVIRDEKSALLDTADAAVTRQFLENIAHALNGQALDYIVINHMEPDHCAGIEALIGIYPEVKLVGNAKTFQILDQFYHVDADDRKVLVQEGSTLPLGKHVLQFLTAPMVHWPEVMMAYEQTEKVLFSADAFGAFGALNGHLFSDEIDFDRDWIDDARRYYANIVGKYGVQVQAALKKAAALEIQTICPLHGPVWRKNLAYFLEKYDKWSRYEPEEQAVAIFYGSMYGNTENAAEVLAGMLAERGVQKIHLYDVSNTHVSTLIAEIFRCSHLILAAPTYNGGIYPAMDAFLHDMKALGLRNRTIGLVENGSWAIQTANLMKKLLGEMKDMRILEPSLSVKSALGEREIPVLQQFCAAICDTM